MKILNVIGCGRVGRTLTRLWKERATFQIGEVFDHSLPKSLAAVEIVGAGRAVGSAAEMHAADVWMLTPSDDQIVTACAALAASGALAPGAIVFHCSGVWPSHHLAAAIKLGARAASVHPLKTFADPSAAIQNFAGTFCAAEGETSALAVLKPAFEAIGAQVTEIDPRYKSIYHAASVFVSNYLTALLEVGARAYEKAGFTRTQAMRLMEPLARETLLNVFKLDTAHALTGPIARGDSKVVENHLQALSAWDESIASLYRELGAVAVELARERGLASSQGLDDIERCLSDKSFKFVLPNKD